MLSRLIAIGLAWICRGRLCGKLPVVAQKKGGICACTTTITAKRIVAGESTVSATMSVHVGLQQSRDVRPVEAA